MEYIVFDLEWNQGGNEEHEREKLCFEIVEIGAVKMNEKVSADELGKLSELFQIPADELLHGRNTEMPVQMFARRFGALDEADQQEILNLIEFKRMMKERM